jgi:proline iminopeptidase
MKIIKTLGKIMLGLAAGLIVLLGLLYVLTMGDYAVPETVAKDPSLPHLNIAGVTYHAETFGDPSNPVVITLHGGPGGDYRSLLSLQALEDDYFMVFFDQRGSGLSPCVNAEEITVKSAIADLDSIVDHFGNGGKVNLVGHSWGAMLASAYVGQHPDKVDHLVLAEPGFLNSEYAQKWAEQTGLKFSTGVFSHFLKTKFESLHVSRADEHAADDYFIHAMNLYEGDDHPQAGYYCEGDIPDPQGSWRFGTQANNALSQEAVDEQGNFDINLVDGVEKFSNTVLFMAGECQTIIGADWQREQMKFFHQAELMVIPDAGHEMFAENSAVSLEVVRAYLKNLVGN